MRKIALAIAAASAMMVVSAPAFAQYNRADPGCSTSVGGNCGRQLDGMNSNWRRLHLPLESGQGAYGTYLPGGRYIPNGGVRVYGGAPQGYGGVPQGYGRGFGARRGGETVTVMVPHPYHRVYYPQSQERGPEDLSWFCGTGNCP